MARTETRTRQVLEILAGRSCPACTDGTLVRDEYKGNRAVVCDTCEVPKAQVW